MNKEINQEENEHQDDIDGELDLRTQLNLETARITWKEIEVLYARGMAMVVAPELDLVEVAALTAENDIDKITPWTDKGFVGAMTAEQAKDWQGREPELWAVVVAPWVFVQERGF